MNPILLLVVILILSNNNKHNTYIPRGLFHSSRSSVPFMRLSYFDTFKMELLLDRLHAMTEALEKLNHLRQIQSLPPSKENTMVRIQDSLDAAKGFLADTKAAKQLDTISDTFSGVRQLGDMDQLISSMGPILSMLTASKEEK